MEVLLIADRPLLIGEVERAALALRKVVAKYPTATEAHQLLAGIYRGQGKTELAMLHDTLAQRG